MVRLGIKVLINFPWSRNLASGIEIDEEFIGRVPATNESEESVSAEETERQLSEVRKLYQDGPSEFSIALRFPKCSQNRPALQ